MQTDIQIQQDVLAELSWQPALHGLQFGVAVKNGVVTLSGQVDCAFQKRTAVRAAKSVAGVKAVVKNIVIAGAGTAPTDADIASAILAALHWNSAIVDHKISIKVAHGVVTLTGETEWDFQRSQAKKMIEKIEGVKLVFNEVALKKKPTPADVQQQVKKALARNAIIASKNIMVDVAGQKVVLRGQVASLAEKEAAQQAAWAAPGVNTVENRLTLTD